MNKENLTQRTLHLAASAKKYSSREMLQQRAHQPMAHRLGKVAAGNIIKTFLPKAVMFEGAKYNLLSSGGEQLVFATDTDVIKVIFSTLTQSQNKAVTEAKRLQDEHALIKKYMGRHWLDTEFSSINYRNWYGVAAIQNRPDIMNSFYNIEGMVDYCMENGQTELVASLSGSVCDLYQETGLYPDLLGPENVHLVDTDRGPYLQILDTLPATPERQKTIDPNRLISTSSLLKEKLGLMLSVNELPSPLVESRSVALR